MGKLKEKILEIIEDVGDSYQEHLVKSAAKGTPPVRDEDTWREYRRALLFCRPVGSWSSLYGRMD